MSKGFQNFMSKKTFHPGSYQNQKRVQEAEEAAEAKRKHEAEKLEQYRKEQELFEQQGLISKESRQRLALSFMYSAPPGASSKKDERDKDEEEEDVIASIQWSKDVKQEAGTKSYAPKRHLHDSDDDEPRIKLKWKRTEPKSKNRRSTTDLGQSKIIDHNIKQERPDTKTSIKQESTDIKRVKKER